MVNKPVATDVKFDAIDSIDAVMHVNQVRDVDLVNYWTGRVVLAIGQGQDAVREVVERLFHRTYGDTFGLAYDSGMAQGKWEQKQITARKTRPSRSKAKRVVRITRSVGAAKKMRKLAKKGK